MEFINLFAYSKDKLFVKNKTKVLLYVVAQHLNWLTKFISKLTLHLGHRDWQTRLNDDVQSFKLSSSKERGVLCL